MKAYSIKKIVSLAMVFVLIAIQSVFSFAATVSQSDSFVIQEINDDSNAELMKTYKKIAEEKEFDPYGNRSEFAIHDLNNDGTLELIIDLDSTIVTGEDNYYYTYKNDKVVLLDSSEAQYPSWGLLDSAPSSGTFCFERGGPAYIDDDGRNVDPFVIIQYAIEGNKIVEKSSVNSNYYIDDGYTEYFMNGNSCSEDDYKAFVEQFTLGIAFY